MNGASILETLPRKYFGDLTDVNISIKLCRTSSLETLLFSNFFLDLIDVQNINIKLSGDSSLETLKLSIYLGNLRR